jgi:hypothetical protein
LLRFWDLSFTFLAYSYLPVLSSFNWDYPYFSVSVQYLELTLALFIIGFALILAGISFPENREIGPEEENQTSASPVAER